MRYSDLNENNIDDIWKRKRDDHVPYFSYKVMNRVNKTKHAVLQCVNVETCNESMVSQLNSSMWNMIAIIMNGTWKWCSRDVYISEQQTISDKIYFALQDSGHCSTRFWASAWGNIPSQSTYLLKYRNIFLKYLDCHCWVDSIKHDQYSTWSDPAQQFMFLFFLRACTITNSICRIKYRQSVAKIDAKCNWHQKMCNSHSSFCIDELTKRSPACT